MRLRYLLSPKLIEKPAFLIHTAELVNHYAPVWDAIAPSEFDIILYGDMRLSPPNDRVTVRNVSEVLASKDRYKILVSNHPVDFSNHNKKRGKKILGRKILGKERRTKPLITRLAEKNIRFMYAGGKTRWNLSDWNAYYDGVLCFGPKHAKAFSEKFGLPVFQMGYPRFDKYFAQEMDLNSLRQKYGCDPQRKTVVWLPTWKGLSSVDHFNDEIEELLSDFNVVVKVHPLMPEFEQERVAALEKIGFTALITDTSDNVALYQIADYMLFDYGGPAFGAIYTGKRFILLNVPQAAEDSLTGGDSSDVQLREELLNVDAGKGEIRPLLTDGPHWDAHIEVTKRLRTQYFAENFGTSANAAASAILDRNWLHRKGRLVW